jgi:hypothetical protein
MPGGPSFEQGEVAENSSTVTLQKQRGKIENNSCSAGFHALPGRDVKDQSMS